MNSVVEKLAAIEKEVAAIQPKMAPLTERITDLHQKVTHFTQQLADLAAESVAVKQDVELTRQSLGKIQTLISESKVESEQLVAGQEENQQRCEAMTAVFGAAFQAVSQFFEAAQQMGLADQAKAVFLSPPPSSPSQASLPSPPMHVAPPVLPEPPATELPLATKPAPDEPVIPSPPPPVKEVPVADTPSENVPVVGLPEVDELIPPEIVPAASETAPPAPPDPLESALSESDFASATSGIIGTEEMASLPVPGLPDVAILPDPHTDADADAEPSEEIAQSETLATHLDVSPLNLAVPALPEQSEPAEMNEMNDQEIEDMLATMMAPVTTAAVS